MTALIFSSILTAFNFDLNQDTWKLVLYSTQSHKSNESGDAVTKLTLAWWACVKTTISVVKRLLCGEPASKLTWARQNPFLFSPSLAPLPIQTKQCFPESKMKTEKKLHKSVVRKKNETHWDSTSVFVSMSFIALYSLHIAFEPQLTPPPVNSTIVIIWSSQQWIQSLR